MTCWVVIPIKPLDQCKTRLRAVLSDGERGALVREMLANVVRAAQSAPSIAQVAVLGPMAYELDLPHLAEPADSDLNAALASARQALEHQGATRLIVAAADLPRVTSADIEALAGVEGVAIAPDRAGAGTNALSLPLPGAHGFRFQFGEGSFARHRAEAEQLGLPLQIIRTDTLALDIDTPADLEFLRAGV